jgi:hypothetical protein
MTATALRFAGAFLPLPLLLRHPGGACPRSPGLYHPIPPGTCCLNSPTLVAPCRLDSFDLSGARMRLMWPNTGGVKPSAW